MSQYDDAYVLSSTSATFRAKFMEKLRNTEAKLKKIYLFIFSSAGSDKHNYCRNNNDVIINCRNCDYNI